MKSLIAFILVGIVTMTMSFAQATPGAIEKVHRFVEGNNTVVVQGKGTVRFMYRDGKIMNPIFQDTAGKTYRLGIGSTSGDPTAGAPGCKDNCDGCSGGCHKVCIDYYCCYGCTGGTLSAGGNSNENAEPTVNISIIKAQ
ncbi:MAG: hypothetical protein U0Y10_07790 [Spirosomataceae bacterium]